MNMSAVGLSLLVVAAVYLLVGAAALLPAEDVAFRTSCVPLTAAIAVDRTRGAGVLGRG
jgi:hypothetical protein